MATFLLTLAHVVGMVAAMIVTKYFGRKTLFLNGAIVQAICFALAAFLYSS